MSDFTIYTEELVRDWMSQGTDTPTPPTDLYVALHTSDPGGSPDGSTEVGASDYDRVAVSTSGGWATTGTGEPSGFENANEVSFGEAQNDWATGGTTVSHVSLWTTADTTGNCLAAYALDSAGEVPSGVEVKFPAGDLNFNVD